MRRSILIMTLFLLVSPVTGVLVRAGERQQSGPLWRHLAGMEDELAGEKLELRDELIAAHMHFVSALEQAADDIEFHPVDPGQKRLAWARIEYLLETAFRLSQETGEWDYFLKATGKLVPDYTAAHQPTAIIEPIDPAGDAASDDGLVYELEDGERLAVSYLDGKAELVIAATAEPLAGNEPVIAKPRNRYPPAADAHVQLIRSRAAWLRGLALENLGRTELAGAAIDGLNLIRDWLVLGPLESDGESMTDLIYGLDELYDSLSADTAYPGKNGPVRWRPFTSVDALGRIFPEALFRTPGVQSAYLLALVHAERNGPAVLRFGSSTPVTVCVNHIQEQHLGFTERADPDQEAVNVWMRQGWNVILIRTSSGHDGWRLAVRLTGLDGKPFEGQLAMPNRGNIDAILAHAKTAARRSLWERFYQAASTAELGGISVLSSWVTRQPDDARANFYLGSLLVSKRMMEGPQRFHRENIFRRALDGSNNDPFFSLMAARSVDAGIDGPDREENLRLVLLKAAADHGSAAALIDMGRLYLDVMRQPRRAGEFAELAQNVNPLSLRAGLLDYDVAVAMGWQPVAKDLLDKLVQKHPTAREARLRKGRAALDSGRYRPALTEYHAVLTVDAGNAEALDGAVMALGMLGQTSAAVDLVASHVERFPYDFRVRLKLAELYRVLGRETEALAVLDAALDMAPDDGEAVAMREEIDQKYAAENPDRAGKPAERPRLRQELDLSAPRQQPANGWEYLYFQVEDTMENNGSLERTVSFAVRMYTERAARMVRHLGLWLESGLEHGQISSLELIQPDGRRFAFTPPAGDGDSVNFYLPPLRPGMVVEAEVAIHRARIPFLGDYFGQIAPLAQQAPIRLSRYMFTSPKDRRIFFRPVNGAPEAMMVESPDGTVTRIWEMLDVPAFHSEPDSPAQFATVPSVQMTSFSDWDELARWYWRLIGGQYHTPPELAELAEQLGRGVEQPLDKLERAAEWMARNIGHREWSFGPYAFRPMNARSILSRLVADGKDRTLFLCLLAREYGLQASPVLARMRDTRFPPSGSEDLALPLLEHFNHSLVMVETGLGGSQLMDASNPYRPAAVVPSQLYGSPAVSVGPDGAVRLAIPDNGVTACRWLESALMVVDEDGSSIWEESIHGTGAAAEVLRFQFRDQETRNRHWLRFLESLGATPTAAAEDFREDEASPSSAYFSGRARLRQAAAMEDNRAVLTLPSLPGIVRGDGSASYPLSLEEQARFGTRDQDLILPYGFHITRRITIKYPEEWRLVNEPVPYDKQYAFGSISLKTESVPGELTLEIGLQQPGHRIAAAEYAAFREFAAQAGRWLQPTLVWERP